MVDKDADAVLDEVEAAVLLVAASVLRGQGFTYTLPSRAKGNQLYVPGGCGPPPASPACRPSGPPPGSRLCGPGAYAAERRRCRSWRAGWSGGGAHTACTPALGLRADSCRTVVSNVSTA